MYKEIDELIEAITKDDVFINFVEAEKKLYDEKVMALLSRHHNLQEDYLRFKNYGHSDELYQQLKEVKKEVSQNPTIQTYYQSYYELNDVLDEMTKIIFQGISDELTFDTFSLGEK